MEAARVADEDQKVDGILESYKGWIGPFSITSYIHIYRERTNGSRWSCHSLAVLAIWKLRHR